MSTYTNYNTISYHRFISGNEARTDDTTIKQEDRKSVGLQRKTLKHRKHKTHSKTIKTGNEHTYTFTQLEATLQKHYYSHSNMPSRIS